MFFADELPTSAIVPSNAVTIVIVLWTVTWLVVAACAVVMVIVSLRRRPAIEAEFTSKVETAAVKGELTAQISDLKTEMISRADRTDADVRRSDQRNEQIAGQTFAKLDAFSASISKEFSTLNHTIGKLEGAQGMASQIVEAMRK